MKLILKGIFFFCLEWSGVNAYFRYKNRGKIKTLMFHSISPPGLFFNNAVSADSFTRQMSYLSKKYSILQLSQNGQLSGYSTNKVNVLLTFDDGFVDNYLVAAPILNNFKITAVFFVIAECLADGSPPSFIKSRQIEQANPDVYKTLTIPQAHGLLAMGMSIGSHGSRHPDYSKIAHEMGIQDAVDSKSFIEAALGVPVESFSFPWGRFQDKQTEILKTAYRRVFTTEHGFNALDDEVFFRNEVANYPHLCCTASGALDFFSILLRRPYG